MSAPVTPVSWHRQGERGGGFMQRLGVQDLVPLRGDDAGWPWDIGAVAILDGTELMDRDGRFRIEAVRRAIEPKLHLVPRFRQLVYRPPPGLGWPLWVDAPSFNLADHVRVFPLPAEADQAQLVLACEQLRRRRLDPSRPRWEAWFLPGLAHGRVGLFVRLHHAMADGVAGVAAFGGLFDLAADPPGPAAPPWTPAPVPSAGLPPISALEIPCRSCRSAPMTSPPARPRPSTATSSMPSLVPKPRPPALAAIAIAFSGPSQVAVKPGFACTCAGHLHDPRLPGGHAVAHAKAPRDEGALPSAAHRSPRGAAGRALESRGESSHRQGWATRG